MSDPFRDLFTPPGPQGREGAKFLSRLFGIFSERVVAIWAADPRAPYQDLGRPTLSDAICPRPATLDFTLRARNSGAVCVAEMKCEIEYRNFRHFELTDSDQLRHHQKPAFALFLRAARPGPDLRVTVGGAPIATSGAILIWGAVSARGRTEVRRAHGFHDVLSDAGICADLARWRNPAYQALLEDRRAWCERLFTGLMTLPPPDGAEPAPPHL